MDFGAYGPKSCEPLDDKGKRYNQYNAVRYVCVVPHVKPFASTRRRRALPVFLIEDVAHRTPQAIGIGFKSKEKGKGEHKRKK